MHQIYDLKYGGSHILYFMYCKRQLYFYLKQFNLEANSSVVQIADIEHQGSFKDQKVKEIAIGPVKIDLINKNTISEIKMSKKPSDHHRYQLMYYIYFLNTEFDLNIKKGVLKYPKIKETIEVKYTEKEKLEIESIVSEIEKIESMDKNPFEVLNDKKCKNCSYQDFCYI